MAKKTESNSDRIDVRLPEERKRIDAIIEEYGKGSITRSQIVRLALREYLPKLESKNKIELAKKKASPFNADLPGKRNDSGLRKEGGA